MNQEHRSPNDIAVEEIENSSAAVPVQADSSTGLLSMDDTQFRVLVETMTEGLLVTDAEDRIVCANKKICALLGYTAEEMHGHYGREFLSSADQHLYDKQQILRRAGGKHRYEINWRAKDSRNVLTLVSPAPRYDASGNFIGSFAVLTELSGVRHIEQELIRERSLLQALMNHLPDGIYVKDIEGRYVTANDAHRAFIGVEDIYDAIGKRTRDFFEIDAFPDHYREDKGVIQSGKAVIAREHRILDRQGQERWIQVSKIPLTDSNGTITGLVGVERDVTEGKLSEEAVRAAVRMEATSTLAGGIAHNFNNLMTIVLANAELLAMNLPADQKNLGMLRSIIGAADDAATLARRLVEFARGGQHQPTDVVLNEIIKDILLIEQNSFPSRVQFESHLKEKLWTTHADPGQIGQVVLALTINAAQAISKEGCVTISTKNIKLTEDDCKKLKHTHPGAYVHLSVQDNGCGMTPEIRERIFDPFFGTKKPGCGLGLAAVYGIIKNHRGHIAVSSTEGEGTKFDVYLPAVVAPRADEQISDREGLRGNETVLIVDDDPRARLLARSALQKLGYSVCEAEDGKRAVDFAIASPNPIDIILLDMIMPVMDGPEAFPLLTHEQPDAKIIVCSGFGLNADTQKLIEEGAHGFLQKPFGIKSLASKIRSLLDDIVLSNSP